MRQFRNSYTHENAKFWLCLYCIRNEKLKDQISDLTQQIINRGKIVQVYIFVCRCFGRVFSHPGFHTFLLIEIYGSEYQKEERSKFQEPIKSKLPNSFVYSAHTLCSCQDKDEQVKRLQSEKKKADDTNKKLSKELADLTESVNGNRIVKDLREKLVDEKERFVVSYIVWCFLIGVQ